jgi:hypothetical protein
MIGTAEAAIMKHQWNELLFGGGSFGVIKEVQYREQRGS